MTPTNTKPADAALALAAEIVEALLADEKDGGYDLTAGMFGTNFSRMVRRWAELELKDATDASPWAKDAPAEPAIRDLIHFARQRWQGEFTYTADEVVARWKDGEFPYERASQPTPAQDAAATVPDDLTRRIFMEHGFTVKEGQTDLKPYVYAAARALLAAAAPTTPQAPALVPLTADERTAAERLVRYVERYLQEQCVGRVFDGAMAGHVSALHQGLLDCDKAGLLKPEPAAGT